MGQIAYETALAPRVPTQPANDSSASPASTAFVQSLIPAGVVLPFAGANAPSGWLVCGGQTVSRVTYPGLYAAIGITYGAGDGSTTFNVPDLRGRVAAGKDDMGGTAANRLTANVAGGISAADAKTLGKTGGASTHLLTTAELAAHSHTGTTNTAGAHSHNVNWQAGGTSGSTSREIALGSNVQATTTAGDHSHTLSIDNTGSSQAHNNLQPTIVLNHIIKAV